MFPDSQWICETTDIHFFLYIHTYDSFIYKLGTIKLTTITNSQIEQF